ncbi:MAG: transcription elongation factor GreA [Bacteroidota bacterium]
MSEINYLTKEGYDKLKDELNTLKTKERKEVADAIQKAREMGDLSENAEYDAAKDRQGLLELKISKLETIIANSRILDTSRLDTGKAYIQSIVTLQNMDNNAKMKYQLVAEQEANIKESKISIKSPVGKALLGKEVGEEVEIKVPAGTRKFKILEIAFD